MHKRILFITAEYPPCGGGGVGRSFSVSTDLAARGHDVTVLTASENMYWVFNEALSYQASPVVVERVKTPNLNAWYSRLKKYAIKLAPTDHFFFWRFLATRKAKKLHKKKPFDLIISSYPFTSNHAVAYNLSKATNVPWIADYRDPPWWMYSSLRPMQPEFFEYAKRAAINVTTTDRAKRLLMEKLDLAEQAVKVLKNGCDALAAELDNQPAVRDTFELLHTGSFYAEGRDINAFIQAATECSVATELRFIGDQPYASTLKLMKTLPDNTSVEFEGYKPSDQVLKIASESNALVVIQGGLFENQIPGKIFECLALQKPLLVITNNGSATYDIVKDEPNAVIAEYGDLESIKLGIEKLFTHQVVSVDRMRYTRDNLLNRYAELVDSFDVEDE